MNDSAGRRSRARADRRVADVAEEDVKADRETGMRVRWRLDGGSSLAVVTLKAAAWSTGPVKPHWECKCARHQPGSSAVWHMLVVERLEAPSPERTF